MMIYAATLSKQNAKNDLNNLIAGFIYWLFPPTSNLKNSVWLKSAHVYY